MYADQGEQIIFKIKFPGLRKEKEKGKEDKEHSSLNFEVCIWLKEAGWKNRSEWNDLIIYYLFIISLLSKAV